MSHDFNHKSVHLWTDLEIFSWMAQIGSFYSSTAKWKKETKQPWLPQDLDIEKQSTVIYPISERITEIFLVLTQDHIPAFSNYCIDTGVLTFLPFIFFSLCFSIKLFLVNDALNSRYSVSLQMLSNTIS